MWSYLSPLWFRYSLKPSPPTLYLPSPPPPATFIQRFFTTLISFLPGLHSNALSDGKPLVLAGFIIFTLLYIIYKWADPYWEFLTQDDVPVPLVHQCHLDNCVDLERFPSNVSISLLPEKCSHSTNNNLDDEKDDVGSIRLNRVAGVVAHNNNNNNNNNHTPPNTLQSKQKQHQQHNHNNNNKGKQSAQLDLSHLPSLPQPNINNQLKLEQQRMKHEEAHIMKESSQSSIGVPYLDEKPEPLNQQIHPLHHFYDLIGARLSVLVQHFAGSYADTIKQGFIITMMCSLFVFMTAAVISMAVVMIQNALVFIHLGGLFVATYIAGRTIGYFTDTRIIEHPN